MIIFISSKFIVPRDKYINENPKSNNPDAKDLRFIVITVPFLEEYTEIKLDPNTKAKYDGMIPPARTIKMKNKLPVDPRFDLENCAYTLKSILEVLGINKAHFIGHDRGCIIMDNMLAEFPEFALSYARGSQGWTRFKEEWLKLTDKGVFLGPPHRIMATKAFPPLLKSALKGGAPFGFIAPSFAKDVFYSSSNQDLQDRWEALQNMPNQSQKFFKLTRQIFRQTDFLDEGKRRVDKTRGFSILDTKFPLMQFQGSEEMLLAKNLPGAKEVSFLRKLAGLFGAGQVREFSGCFVFGFQHIYLKNCQMILELFLTTQVINPILVYGTFGLMR